MNYIFRYAIFCTNAIIRLKRQINHKLYDFNIYGLTNEKLNKSDMTKDTGNTDFIMHLTETYLKEKSILNKDNYVKLHQNKDKNKDNNP